jgi:quercetin dioxygenase-like cupin family protein
MSEPKILYFDQVKPVSRGRGVETKPLVGHWLEAQGFTCGITSFPVGAEIAFHSHNVEEAVTILEGSARCDVEGQSYDLKAWDTTYVPAGISHRFVNTGSGVMRILWVYATTHITRTFTETGATVEHLSGNDLAGGSAG